MPYEIKGEAEVQSGFGLPRLTTAQRVAYSPPSEGYTVWDTLLKKAFFWTGSAWTTFFRTEQMAFPFQGILDDATEVVGFPVVVPFEINAAPSSKTGESLAECLVAPTGGPAVFEIYKNTTVIGTITFADGETEASIEFSSAVAYAKGDRFSISSITQFGATRVSISLLVLKAN